MRIALTGISGFIGSVIARHAAEAGHQVVGLVRGSSRHDHIERYVEEFVVGAQDDESVRATLLDRADALVHNAFDWSVLKNNDLAAHLASNLEGSIKLCRAAGERHVVYMSTIAVHHRMHPNWAGTIDDTHPLQPGTMYGACKAALEAHLWANHEELGQPITAFRPCAVYGIDPNPKRSIGWPILEALQRGKSFEKAGGGKFVHVDDVAAATIASLERPAASPRVYNLVDCYARWGDWAQMAADCLDIDASINLESPEQPNNSFDKTSVQQELGVAMDRGFDGIRAQLRELVALRAGSSQ